MSDDVRPITPQEARKNRDIRRKAFPREVIEAFNELIAFKFDGQEASFLQKTVVDLILDKMTANHQDGSDRETIRKDLFKNNWLDVEYYYSLHGWSVTYDKPGYNERGEASFSFRVRKEER